MCSSDLHGEAEALEFLVRDESAMTGITLEELDIKNGVLLACIIRYGKVIIPNGKSTLMKNDFVIVVITITGM